MSGSVFSRKAIERLLRPRSVAVVGASPTPGALGASVIANLERLRFGGDIHLVNPKRDMIGARACVKSVADLPRGVDVAVLAIPRVAVLDAVRSLIEREAGAAIIFSAGFAEGGEEGLAEQRELARLAIAGGLVVEGPNCLGLVNYVDGIALTFVETPAKGLQGRPGIGIVSQSGAMAAVVGVTLAAKDLGISYSVSTGNEAATGIEDYLDYLLEDPHTRQVGLIVEQFRQPRRFLELARHARELGKPIVLLHPGRSSAARESAATHTGALAGDYGVMATQVRHAGVLLTETLEEFTDVLDLVARCRPLPARGSAVVTESGAFKALTLDFCEDIGLPLPALTNADAPLLRAALPDFVPVSNPVDVTAQALVDPDLYRRTLAALLADARFGCVVLCIIQTDEKTSRLKFPTIIAALEQLERPIPVVFAGLDDGAVVPPEFLDRLRALDVPYFPTTGRAFRAVARVCAATRAAATQGAATPAPVAQATSTPAAVDGGDAPAGEVIPEYRSKELLQRCGLEFPPARLARTLEEALAAAGDIGYPLVLKAQAAALPHKSDAGGVVLNLKDADGLTQGWHRLHANLARSRPDLLLDGVLVEKMSAPGVELIIGGRSDPEWGPIVLAGFGGVQAEILRDVTLLPADANLEHIERELYALKSAELLRGFRGSPALDVAAVARIVASVGGLMRQDPSIREIDLNPVIVYPRGEGALALDALIYRR